jgi:fimbrial chaperone protein
MRNWILAAAVAVALCPPAQAGIGVSPVRVTIPAGQRSTAITLSNGSDVSRRVQIEVYRCTRSNGEDVLTPEPGVLLNPPLFDLVPGGSQVVRLGFRAGSAPPPQSETAFRVFFQEVPHEQTASARQLRMVLRIGVPVFAQPERPLQAQRWSATASGGVTVLALHNDGNTHVRLADLRVFSAPGGAPLALPGFAYVFPGETHRWTLDVAATGNLRLEGMTDAGPLHAELPVQTE